MIWTPEHKADAAAEIKIWSGTPHFDRMAVPGVGIDCLHFVLRVIQAAGLLPAFTFPYYSPRLGIGCSTNVLERILTTCAHVEPIRCHADQAPGDLIIFRVGKQSNHIGLLWEEDESLGVWHAVAKDTVRFDHISEGIRQETQISLRFTAPGFRLDPAALTPEDFKPWAETVGNHTQ